MRNFKNLYEIGCHCVMTDNGEYRFCVTYYTLCEEIRVPAEVDGIPVTEVFFECDLAAFRSNQKSILKRIFITDRTHRIEKYEECYAFMIPEIIIDENNPNFRFVDGVLYERDRLLFAANNCGKTCKILPGTTEICKGAFLGSKLGRVILPPSVCRVGDEALGICRYIEVFDNIDAKVIYVSHNNVELIVRSVESGKVVYKIFFTGRTNRDYRINQNRNISDLDFDYYDKFFDNLDSKIDFREKVDVSVYRLLYPYRLSKDAEARYKKFLSEYNTKAVKTVINKGDNEKFNFLLEFGAVVPENLEELTDYCVQRGKTEFTALLLNYKNENFPDLPPSFSLE